jgi:hypothetical protein
MVSMFLEVKRTGWSGRYPKVYAAFLFADIERRNTLKAYFRILEGG